MPVENLARTSYAYVHPCLFSSSLTLIHPSSLSYSFVTICDYLFVQLLHVLPVSCVHLSHFILSFQIWEKLLWHCSQPSFGQRGTARVNAYTSPFKVYCLACHISMSGLELLMWFVYGVWRRDPHPSDLQAAPRIASTWSLLQTEI